MRLPLVHLYIFLLTIMTNTDLMSVHTSATYPDFYPNCGQLIYKNDVYQLKRKITLYGRHKVVNLANTQVLIIASKWKDSYCLRNIDLLDCSLGLLALEVCDCACVRARVCARAPLFSRFSVHTHVLKHVNKQTNRRMHTTRKQFQPKVWRHTHLLLIVLTLTEHLIPLC